MNVSENLKIKCTRVPSPFSRNKDLAVAFYSWTEPAIKLCIKNLRSSVS